MKNHPSKNWDYSSVKRLLKKIGEAGSMEIRHGSWWPRTVSTEGNMDLIEELVCTQEERPHIHLAPRKTAEQTEISRYSIRRIVKKGNLKQFQCLKTPQMSEGSRNRRETRAGFLRERFESNIRMIEKMVWQDEKNFSPERPVNLQNDRTYAKGKKSDIPDEN